LLSRHSITEKLRLFKPGRDSSDEASFQHPVNGNPIPAAVLIPIIHRHGKLSILLTKRTAHLNHHAGQVSFPGGRVSEEDNGRQFTALRETEEEIGLKLDESSLIGKLPEYDIRTGFRVTPMVGWIESPFDCTLDPYEVESIFEVPMDLVLSVENYQISSDSSGLETRHYYRLPYPGYDIWGATAGMLRHLAIALIEA
jgi:8-oxo-dGTP pyrophosphatase MutT (NUDIX family)